MQYVLHLFADESGWARMTPEQQEAGYRSYMAYTQALKDAGVFVASERLRPVGNSTQVRVSQDGKTHVVDGPYADTKEQLGGFYMIDVPDLDAAISWAARCPGASHGTVEVRPVWPAEVPA
jgi:hypothetical protein